MNGVGGGNDESGGEGRGENRGQEGGGEADGNERRRKGGGDGGGLTLTVPIEPQKALLNVEVAAVSVELWKAYDDDDAMLWSVLSDTPPKPTVKIEMPICLTWVAVLIAELEPPY